MRRFLTLMLRACAALILGSAGGGGTRTSAMGKVIFIFDRFGSRGSIDNLVLADGDQWEDRVALTPAHAGDDQNVEFLLYKDGGSEPYRSLHLRLDVKGTAIEESEPEQLPSPTPTSGRP